MSPAHPVALQRPSCQLPHSPQGPAAFAPRVAAMTSLTMVHVNRRWPLIWSVPYAYDPKDPTRQLVGGWLQADNLPASATLSSSSAEAAHPGTSSGRAAQGAPRLYRSAEERAEFWQDKKFMFSISWNADFDCTRGAQRRARPAPTLPCCARRQLRAHAPTRVSPPRRHWQPGRPHGPRAGALAHHVRRARRHAAAHPGQHGLHRRRREPPRLRLLHVCTAGARKPPRFRSTVACSAAAMRCVGCRTRRGRRSASRPSPTSRRTARSGCPARSAAGPWRTRRCVRACVCAHQGPGHAQRPRCSSRESRASPEGAMGSLEGAPFV